MHSNAQSDQVADSYQRNFWFMDTSVFFLTDVTYDFSKHIWFTGDTTPVPSVFWETGFPVIHLNVVYGVNLMEPHELNHIPVRANSSNYFACQNDESDDGNLVVQQQATFDKALDFCAQLNTSLKTSLTDQEKREYLAWQSDEFGFVQNFRGSLWSDLVLYNKTHYR